MDPREVSIMDSAKELAKAVIKEAKAGDTITVRLETKDSINVEITIDRKP